MTAERGDYRAIRIALINGPDYQRLSAPQRLVLLTLKVTFHSAGIEVHYPEALAHQLAAQTGLSVDQVRLSLEVLDHGGWIAREGNIVWIRGQLEYGNLAVGNPKHRAAIRNAVSGLPHLSIVGQYVREHEAWFMGPAAEGAAPLRADGFGWAFQGPSAPNPMPTECQSNANGMPTELKDDTDTISNCAPNGGADESGTPSAPPTPDKPPSDWAYVFAQDYNAASEGVISPGEVGKQVKPLYAKHPYPVVHSRWLWFVASPKREFGVAWFRKNFGSLVDPAPRIYSGDLSPEDFKRLSA